MKQVRCQPGVPSAKAWAACAPAGGQVTQATRSRLVAPGVPNGRPAVITMLSPGCGEAFRAGELARLGHHLVEVVGVGGVDRVDAPGQRQLAGGDHARDQPQDRAVGALARGPQRGGAGGGVGDDHRRLQRVRDLLSPPAVIASAEVRSACAW